MSYADWIASYGTLTPEAPGAMREALRHLACSPLISILLPVYNPDLTLLEEAIQSVQEQIYENREVFLSLGGLIEKNLPRHFHDVDLCLRAWEAGLRVAWTPHANVTSAGAGLRDSAQSSQEARYTQERGSRQLHLDPFYNPNLSFDPAGFGIAFPPRS